MEKKTQKKYRILIIDDHPLFREGLKAIVGRHERFKIVGETGSGREGFRMAKRLRPDLVVMEISLPDQDAIELIRDLRGLYPQINVMVLSVFNEIDNVSQAMQAGASGYAVKEVDPETLFTGFEAVLHGDFFLGKVVAPESVDDRLSFPPEHKKYSDTLVGCLTPREKEVMRMMAEGFTRKQIAERLCISPKTVENHAWRMMKKLSLNNTFELVRYAAKLGLIDVDLWKVAPVVPDRLMVQRA